MEELKKKQKENNLQSRNWVELVLLLVLALYPLRHINWGLDLWDTGYNYANFTYMGMEHMDSMWLFSTYLATALGHFFTLLPDAGTLMGMNFYTGLLASVLGLAGYLFCRKVLKMPMWIAFVGEFAALSMCWCPTALLYNYLTYVFFLISFILLYCGLAQEKKWYLVAAGVFLGSNVLVRFSNLPEMGMIVAVWGYDVIATREKQATRSGICFSCGDNEQTACEAGNERSARVCEYELEAGEEATRSGICFSCGINEQTACEAGNERSARVCEYELEAGEEATRSGICFSCGINEQTACEAGNERSARVCEYELEAGEEATRSGICFSCGINEQTACEAGNERSARVCEYELEAGGEATRSGICFSCGINEQTACEAGNERSARVCEYELEAGGEATRSGFWKRTLAHTGWCLLGYLSALLVLFGYIGIRYGLDEYVAGISRLFAMTENATDYKATSMLMGIVGTYIENLYWFIRILIIILGGMLFAAFVLLLAEKEKLKKQTADRIVRIFSALLAGAMIFWLYFRGFVSFTFYSYDSMLRPGILFLMLAMLIAVIRIFQKNCAKEEKLLSGMLVLVILLTSLGSNNGVYPSMNNMFIVAPYVLWETRKFLKYAGEKKISCVILCAVPVKTVLVAFLLLCAVHFSGFGAGFVFAEATGVRDAHAYVTNNEILRGIRMSPDKAQCMTELSEFVAEKDLQGQEVLLYGNVPALSYYLQMPSAFNPWSDLRSYAKVTMEQELEALDGEKPLIILGNAYAVYEESGAEAVKALGLSAEVEERMLSDTKWELLKAFMEKSGYEQVLRNEKVAVYR